MITAGLHKGEVVWYNDHRGYGFISIEGDEIFIHRSVLERFGLNFLHSGDIIKIDVATNDDGPAIMEIRAVERIAPESLPKDTVLRENEVRGIVKFFNPLKGYGFVEIQGMKQDRMCLFIPAPCKLAGFAAWQKGKICYFLSAMMAKARKQLKCGSLPTIKRVNALAF